MEKLKDYHQMTANLGEKHGAPKSLRWRSNTAWSGNGVGGAFNLWCDDNFYVSQFHARGWAVLDAVHMVCNNGKELHAGGWNGHPFPGYCSRYSRVLIAAGWNGVGALAPLCNNIPQYVAGNMQWPGTKDYVHDLICPEGTYIYGMFGRSADGLVKGIAFYCGGK
jgi:hypothetical protein